MARGGFCCKAKPSSSRNQQHMYYSKLLKSPSEFLDEWHVEYKKVGNKSEELLAKCVFSDCDNEKKDSYHLYINAEDGRCNCKKCSKSGNLVTIAKKLGIDTKGIYENERKVKIKPNKVPDAPATIIEPVTDQR